MLTVPSGVLYPMCGMNLAFDRSLIGPAMWFGLMGEGQPLGRYDDMWAGWCSKVVCDHLGLGVKTGKPYVWHSKASDPLVNLEKEFKGIMWQEHMVAFFRSVELPKEATTAAGAYAALASALRRSALPEIDPYFLRVADGMETWLECWRELNPEMAAAEAAEQGKERAPRVVLSGEERASASARGPAAAAASCPSCPRPRPRPCSSSSSVSASAAPAPAPAPSKSDDDGDEGQQENTAPFTPQMASSSSRPLQLAGKGRATAAAAEEEIAGLFSKATV